MISLKIVRKSVRRMWLDETKMVRLKIVRKSVRRMWLDKTKMVRLKSLRRNLIGQKRNLAHMTMRPTCRVLPDWSDWTRRNLVLSSGNFWLADPMDLSSGNASDWLIWWICLQRLLLTSLFISLRDFIQPYAIDKKRLRESVFFLRRIRRSICCWRAKQTKRPSPLFTYSIHGGVTLLCTMPMMWLGKCVRVVLAVNISIHSYIFVRVLHT